jgi:hypothetical protein
VLNSFRLPHRLADFTANARLSSIENESNLKKGFPQISQIYITHYLLLPLAALIPQIAQKK